MTYVVIPNSVFEAGKPARALDMRNLRDNIPSALKGESGAPVLSSSWHPYDMVNVGDGSDGVFYDFSVDGVQATVTSPSFEDGYEYRVHVINFSTNGAGSDRVLRAELYREVDAAYGNLIAVSQAAGISAGDHISGIIDLPFVRKSVIGQPVVFHLAKTNIVGAFNSANGSTFCVRNSQKRTNIRLSWDAGSIDNGSAILLKRRAFLPN